MNMKVAFIAANNADQIISSQTISANNLANVSTNGFRADFNQVRTEYVDTKNLSTKAYAVLDNPVTDFKSGTLIKTDRALDVAIQGSGFFSVLTPSGKEGYTRNGNICQTAEGMLVVNNNFPLMGDGGPITIPQAKKVDIGSDGTISYVPVDSITNTTISLGKIKLVNPDSKTIYKADDGFFYSKNKGNAIEPSLNVKIINGFLESSNVNAVYEITNMIQLARDFEMAIKLMETVKENDELTAQILQV